MAWNIEANETDGRGGLRGVVAGNDTMDQRAKVPGPVQGHPDCVRSHLDQIHLSASLLRQELAFLRGSVSGEDLDTTQGTNARGEPPRQSFDACLADVSGYLSDCHVLVLELCKYLVGG